MTVLLGSNLIYYFDSITTQIDRYLLKFPLKDALFFFSGIGIGGSIIAIDVVCNEDYITSGSPSIGSPTIFLKRKNRCKYNLSFRYLTICK